METKRYIVSMKLEIEDTEMRTPFNYQGIDYKLMSKEEIMDELQGLWAHINQFR